MTKRHNTLVILIAVLISVFIWVSAMMKNQRQYSSRTFKTQKGWGYEILVNDSLFIHQEFIPAMVGRKGFQNEAQARSAAKSLINKLRQGLQPRLTSDELTVIESIKEDHDPTQGNK